MTQLSTLKNYVRSLFKRGELTEKQYKKLRPQNARVGRAHVYQKFTKTLQCYRNLDQLLIRPLNVTTMLALI